MLINTNVIGDMSEALVTGYLASQGHEVFLPLGGHSRTDLVYLNKGVPVKAQIKTAAWTKGSTSPHHYEQCPLGRTPSGAYTADEVDEFWIVGTHLWCFPYNIVTSIGNVSLGTTNPSPRKTIRTYDPNDYIVVKGAIDRPFRNRLYQDDDHPFQSVTNNEYNPETLRAMQYK